MLTVEYILNIFYQGYNTRVGQLEGMLSGGQKQRVVRIMNLGFKID